MHRVATAALSAAAFVVIPGLCLAADTHPTRVQLQQKLNDLKSRIAQLESEPAGPDPREQARIIDEMVADAQRRSQLLFADEAITGGFDLEKTKFFIRSADGNFLFVPGSFIQLRYTANFNSDGDDEANKGFEVRRLKLIAEGHAFTPDLQYKAQFESAGGEVVLQDAWMRYKFAKQWQYQLGQFKDIWNHEELNGDQYGLAAERSLLNALIGGGQTDRLQGMMVMFDDKEHWRANFLYHDGFNSDNTGFDGGGGSNFIGVIPTDFGFSGRLEYFVFGPRKAYDDFTPLRNKEGLLVIGGGASYSQAGDSDVLFHTVDGQWENSSGMGLYMAYVGAARSIGDDSPVPAGDYYDIGGIVQGSYLFTEKLEGFARGAVTVVDDDSLAAGAEDTFPELTLGMNYYFQKHHVKLTVDFSWIPNGSPINVLGAGIFAGEDDQFVVRTQFQLFI